MIIYVVGFVSMSIYIVSTFYNFQKYIIRNINGESCTLVNVNMKLLHLFETEEVLVFYFFFG